MNIVCPSCGATNRVPEARLNDQPVCGRCGTELMALTPVTLSDTVFASYVGRSDLPVLVDFWADWCGPCKMMAPHFASAAAQMPGVRFAKLDTEANAGTAAAYAIRSIPTLVLFSGGREIARQSGAMSAGDLMRWVNARLSNSASSKADA